MNLDNEKIELIELHKERKIANKEQKEYIRHFNKRMAYYLSFYSALFLIISFIMIPVDDEWDFLIPAIGIPAIVITCIIAYICSKRDRINFPVYFNFNSDKFNELLDKMMTEIEKEEEQLVSPIRPYLIVNLDNVTAELKEGVKC